jgi:hypothetical protein
MQFYVLERSNIGSVNEKVAGTEARDADGTNRGEAPRCPECGSYVGMLTWLPPYRVELETWGREYGDFAFVGTNLLVSKSFKDVWDRSSLSGLHGFDPVEVVKIKHHRELIDEPPAYFKANVVRSQAALDHKASQSEWDGAPDFCATCRLPKNKVTCLRRKATVIEPGTWSGEDIFIARASADFFVTPRFKELCEQHNMKNAVFIPAEQHGVDFYPSEATLMQPILGRWEDKKQSAAERWDAYCTLVFWITGERIERQLGKADPDRDVDPTIIDEVRRRIYGGLENV